MNVRELIEKLQEFDQELPVGLEYAENYEDDECDYWIQRFELTVSESAVEGPLDSTSTLEKQPCILISPGY